MKRKVWRSSGSPSTVLLEEEGGRELLKSVRKLGYGVVETSTLPTGTPVIAEAYLVQALPDEPVFLQLDELIGSLLDLCKLGYNLPPIRLGNSCLSLAPKK